MNPSELKAMITLLDDDDPEVVEHVENQIKNIGQDVITVLEKEWESQGLNPLIQKKLEDLVHDLQLAKLKTEFKDWKNRGSANLLEGLWLINRYQFPELKLETLQAALKKIYYQIWLRMKDEMHPNDIAKNMNYVIFDELGFESNTKDFHATSNSMLSQVLEQKKGNPVALSCLYILLAEQLDLPLYGVNLPNLFVVIFDYPGYKFYINAFNRGQFFLEKDINEYLKQLKIEPEPKFYKACNNQDIILRILTNLSFSFHKLGDTNKQNEVDDLINIFRE
jgi:regulator of sirC expression with transglutaminase-like and TPR domain